MIIRKEVEGTYFGSAFLTGNACSMTLEQYIGKVKSDEFARQIAYLHGLVKAGKKDEADAYKKKLPLYVAGGVMEGGRRLEHMVRYSACVVIDIDDSPIAVPELLLRAAALPYVKAGHGSPSYTGAKFFALVDSDLEHHKQAFEVVRRRIEADLPGVTVDVSGKDPNRGCFASHDRNAFYKEESEVLEIPVAGSELLTSAGQPSGGTSTGMRLSNYIDKYEEANPFVPGSRHSYIVKLASALNNAGFSPYDAVRECVCRYVSADFPAAEVETTVTDIFRRYSASHGSCAYHPDEVGLHRKTVKTVETSPPVPGNAHLMDGWDEMPDIEPDSTLLPCFDKAVYDNLPPLLTDILKRADSRTERDVLLISSVTLLSSVMPGVKGSLDEHDYSPALYTIVTGSSGSGKGCIAGLQKLLDPWQQYVYDNSRHYVEEYEAANEEYENYKMRKRQNRAGKEPLGPPPSKPKVVKQMNLHLTGHVTQARLVELLDTNSPYTSCMMDTEMETIATMMSQDFGNFGDILNKAAHHETVGSSSKNNGTYLARRPSLALLWSGTPAILPRLIPSTENGLFSRMLMYKIAGGGEYRPLTSADDTPAASLYMDSFGQRVLDIGVFLDGSPTWVRFSDAQRKRLDRFFKGEYYNVRFFGNEDLESTVLRYRLAIFRIAMTLTGLRKGESGSTERTWTIREDDFNTAFHLGKICLQHAYVVATSLKRASSEVHFKFPHHMQNLFASLPDTFKRADVLAGANVRGVSESSVDRFLRKAEKYNLIVSEGAGYYSKTDAGKKIVAI
ncbi:DUF3987 domain-containing protein [uncultured Parabacteroides sp.]|uniref:DUF3987 domain-containing protein n=1 Tax=uncultured Parabacteroides sp. TaxID=512312 RepID=UPI0025CDD19C|nr:DUF3987 domain-containing protein [uncultured Parabacteroides sp.]